MTAITDGRVDVDRLIGVHLNEAVIVAAVPVVEAPKADRAPPNSKRSFAGSGKCAAVRRRHLAIAASMTSSSRSGGTR